MKKSIINLSACIIVFLLLCSCAKGSPYFKKSPSNKLIDRRGFEGAKRRPLYNNKYIDVAKKNIENKDYDEKEDYDLSEERDPPSDSIHMYQKMMEMEKKRVLANMKKSKEKDVKNSNYPSLSQIKPESESNSVQMEKDAEDLKKQIEEMKALVNEMQNQISGSKCGLQQNQSYINKAPVNLCPTNGECLEGSQERDTEQKMCYPK